VKMDNGQPVVVQSDPDPIPATPTESSAQG
jgi:hypothetical protein